MKERGLRYAVTMILGGLIVAMAAAVINRTSMTISMLLAGCASTLTYLIVMDIDSTMVKAVRNKIIRVLWYLAVTGILAAAFTLMGSIVWFEDLTLGYFLGSFIGVFLARLSMTIYGCIKKRFR